ncbi:glycolate oxidase subunit GlcF [Microbaculum marinum]|uniref:Glycolate oxidase iron-sulfur subunit n=1 Tax=Microbaculum marinum TaxID=1764581 RepID=A0AAW9RG17_9HYPH
MQTNFSLAQLADPHMASSEKILRTCVHCGFCTATCPTYLELGDELDSPRGRIYLIKDMLEAEKPASEEVVRHIDRCLSCLSCMTTCPSGVHYMHLVDHARAYIEDTYERPWHDRAMRALLAAVLPYPERFRLALAGATVGRLMLPVVRAMPGLQRLAAMLSLAPASLPPRSAEGPAVFDPLAERRGRVALLTGCAQPVLDPGINAATIRLLTRLGVEVVLPSGEGCCGALVHHMGREAQALDFARANIDAWTREIETGGLDAIVITASGCGTTIKDYAFMLRNDPAYAEKAAAVSALARDITEYLATLEFPEAAAKPGLTVAYHSACSMQHGQQIREEPKELLRAAGFTVRDVPEGHICCGSAGTYNILQPELAARLRTRKVRNIESTRPDLIATGNIGCMTQIGAGTSLPIVHTVELLDWIYGGDRPEALSRVG